MLKVIIFIPICIILSVSKVSCSAGDRSPFYQKCVSKCLNNNCTADREYKRELAQNQDFWSWLLRWSCDGECQYECMWLTVQEFQRHNFEIPQFHGKWPFMRILGMQEPASTFASLLNLLSHVVMYWKLKKEFPFSYSGMAAFWHCFLWVCMTAWVWSAIFHARDVPFTEFMDYACAFSMVHGLLIAAIFRITYQRAKVVGMLAIFLATLYYLEHIRYLYGGDIDYGYNMMTNIIVGMVASLLWLSWVWYQFSTTRQWHVQYMILFILLSVLMLLLEIFEFPPYYGWDAHALWHLNTTCLPLALYRFVIEDLKYLSNVKHGRKGPKYKEISNRPKDDLKLP